MKTIRDGTIHQLVGYAMRPAAFSVNANPAVAIHVKSVHPKPASILVLDV
jgi:hypothetical protein